MAEKKALKGLEAAAAREADASMERERQKAILHAQVAPFFPLSDATAKHQGIHHLVIVASQASFLSRKCRRLHPSTGHQAH